jgi:hypothetical protein
MLDFDVMLPASLPQELGGLDGRFSLSFSPDRLRPSRLLPAVPRSRTGRGECRESVPNVSAIIRAGVECSRDYCSMSASGAFAGPRLEAPWAQSSRSPRRIATCFAS